MRVLVTAFRSHTPLLAVAVWICAFAGPFVDEARAVTCSSIEQYGVTFALDAAYSCGQFVNGDPWVASAAPGGSVGIEGITPEAANGRNGWMLNPSTSAQAYDSRIASYQAMLLPTLPRAVAGGTSVVKGVSEPLTCAASPDHRPCLTTAVVLTVLDEPPADDGAHTFRPPYYGTFKPLYSTNEIGVDQLPGLTVPASAPSLATVAQRFQRVQLDHLTAWTGRYMHPSANFASGDGVSEYGSEISRDNTDAVLRMLLADVTQPEAPALVNVIQAGIDWYGIRKAGSWVYANGGHGMGRKLMVAFAAAMLDEPDMAATAQLTFSEDEFLYRSPDTGRVLWGQTCNAGVYETVRLGGSGSRDCRDPEGYIDGGEIAGDVYQFCCTSIPMRGISTAVRYMPALSRTYGSNLVHEYVDRWMSHGAWTLPDPWNRFPDLHGSNMGGGTYGSAFQVNMWSLRPPLDTRITGGPVGTVTTPAATLAFDGWGAPGSFACRLDDAAWTTCDSGGTYASVADGQHEFQVRAVYSDGAVDATPASRTWTVDTAAPTVSMQPLASSSPGSSIAVSGTAADVTSGIASITVSVSDGSGSVGSCGVAERAGATWSCSWDSSGLAAGTYLVVATATDGAGHTATASTTLVLAVDRAPTPDPDPTPDPNLDHTPDPTVRPDATDPIPQGRTVLPMRIVGPRMARCPATRVLMGVRCPSFTIMLGASASNLRLELEVQRLRAGRWTRVQRAWATTDRAGWARASFQHGASRVTLGRYRVRWRFAGNATYAPSTSAWRGLRSTR